LLEESAEVATVGTDLDRPPHGRVAIGERLDELHLLRKRHLRSAPAPGKHDAEDACGAQFRDEIGGYAAQFRRLCRPRLNLGHQSPDIGEDLFARHRFAHVRRSNSESGTEHTAFRLRRSCDACQRGATAQRWLRTGGLQVYGTALLDGSTSGRPWPEWPRDVAEPTRRARSGCRPG